MTLNHYSMTLNSHSMTLNGRSMTLNKFILFKFLILTYITHRLSQQ